MAMLCSGTIQVGRRGRRGTHLQEKKLWTYCFQASIQASIELQNSLHRRNVDSIAVVERASVGKCEQRRSLRTREWRKLDVCGASLGL